MIAIDTNIIVRFLTHDDEQQYKKAYAVFQKDEIFIPDTVVLETEWVLRFAYGFSPERICTALIKLFGLGNIHLSNATQMMQAIEWYGKGLDFSDALHLAYCQNYAKLYTFDKKFSAKSRGLTGCSVVSP